MKIWYFGAWSGSDGHSLRNPSGSSYSSLEKELPFSPFVLDSHLIRNYDIRGWDANSGNQTGEMHFSVIGGFAILSWWDQTADSRPASNSSFVFSELHSFSDLIAFAREAYPKVFERCEKHYQFKLSKSSKIINSAIGRLSDPDPEGV